MAVKQDGAIETPKMDIAQKQVLAIEEANASIKELIIKSKKEAITFKEFNKQVETIINENGKVLNNYPDTKKLYIRSMKANTQKWLKLYSENLKVINKKIIANFNKKGIKIPSIEIDFSKTIDFRPYVINNKKGLPLIKSYEKEIQKEIRKLVNDNPKTSYYDKNGKVRTRNLRNEAETRIRLKANREDVQIVKGKNRFVITTTHADCSPRCQPWQGRLYSTDGTSGYKDGKHFVPLEKAMEGKNGDGNGILSGYNCRHRALPYKTGMRAPKEYSKQEIKKQQKIDTKQRYYENRIRKMKLEEKLARQQGYEERANELKDRYKRENKKYEVFSFRNKRAYYPWRTEIGNEGVI